MLNGKSVTVDYCTPSLKGRQIGKEIVPYDKVWRTGANTATTLKTQTDLRIGNLSVPAGTYTLYTLPSAQGWKSSSINRPANGAPSITNRRTSDAWRCVKSR